MRRSLGALLKESQGRNYFALQARRGALAVEEVVALWERHLAGIAKGRDNVCFYVHIPFCTSACHFCQYFFWKLTRPGKTEAYADRLIATMARFVGVFKGTRFKALYFGGGTASLLSADQMGRVFEAIEAGFQFEPGCQRTFECNPSSVNAQKLRVMGDFGINRVSFGVQSLDEGVLAHMKRSYQSFDAVRGAIAQAKALSKPMLVNVDLIIGSKLDSARSVAEDFGRLAQLGPDTISLYALQPTIEYLGAVHAGDERAFCRQRDAKIRAFFRLVKPALKRYGYGLGKRAKYLPDTDAWAFLSRSYRREQAQPRFVYDNSKAIDCFGVGAAASSTIFGKARYEEREDGGYEGLALNGIQEEKLQYVVSRLLKKKVSLDVYRSIFGSELARDFPAALSLLKKLGAVEVKQRLLSLRPMGHKDKALYSLLFSA